jgi:hypothetical protein
MVMMTTPCSLACDDVWRVDVQRLCRRRRLLGETVPLDLG